MDTSDFLFDLPSSKTWNKIQPLNKGWSKDIKYYIETECGDKRLLRLSDISSIQFKQQEFDFLKSLEPLKINVPKPLEFGICGKDQFVYSLLTWMDGTDAESALKSQSEVQQYQHGICAGEILKKIHFLHAPVDQTPWDTRYLTKKHQKIRNYHNCPHKIDNDNKFIAYIIENEYLLHNRPQVYQHGDFHTGNLVISSDNTLGVIDFSGRDIGDPWEEFNRLVFSYRASIPFTNGQIHGYFNNQVPHEFFKLMALYIVTNAISSIPWAVEFGQAEIDYMVSNADAIYSFYDGFRTYIPLWYKPPKEFN